MLSDDAKEGRHSSVRGTKRTANNSSASQPTVNNGDAFGKQQENEELMRRLVAAEKRAADAENRLEENIQINEEATVESAVANSKAAGSELRALAAEQKSLAAERRARDAERRLREVIQIQEDAKLESLVGRRQWE